MQLGKVIGSVVATQKDPGLTGQRLLVVQPLTPELKPTGKRLICLDSIGTGAGEIIYWCRGKESSFPFLPAEVPSDGTIVGVVDCVSLGEDRC